MEIYRVMRVDRELTDAFGRLMPQLSGSLSAPSDEQLRLQVESPQTSLWAARIDGHIVGVLSMAWYDVPSGRKAWIEDVVVDSECRGAGVGAALVEAALRQAEELGVDCVMLTSNPARVAAHGLYRKAGFEIYETTLFRRWTGR